MESEAIGKGDSNGGKSGQGAMDPEVRAEEEAVPYSNGKNRE
jgi:hypothetical protein